MPASAKPKAPYTQVLGQLNDLPEDNPFLTMYQRTHGQSAQKQKQSRGSNMGRYEVKQNTKRPQTGVPSRNKTAHVNKSVVVSATASAAHPTFDTKENRTPKNTKKNLLNSDRQQSVSVVQNDRRFGQYAEKQHPEPAQLSLADFAALCGTKTSQGRLIPAGHFTDGRQTRCTDRFVRYAYPKNMRSKYAEQHESKNKRALIKSHKEAFNLEKEAKILNPSQMKQSMYTTHGKCYKGVQERTERPPEVKHVEPEKPCNKSSTYAKNFPNWDNGKMDVFHEKHPQYPYYQQPHRGKSHYQEQFTKEQMRAFQKQQEELKDLCAKAKNANNSLKLGTYASKPFTFATTNNEKLKDFKIATQFVNDQPKYQSGNDQPGKRVHQVVRTQSLPGHFRTIGQQTWVNHNNIYRQSQADFIPYP